MLERVRAFAEKYQMIRPGDRIIAGVSGGADSVCLLILLKELCREKEASLSAVHVHHGLRGKEADEDQAYVEGLCRKLQIPLRIFSFDVRERAIKEHKTLEEAGRLCRYEAFAEEAKRLGGARIAVAHHAGDQAETVLFQLFRGSGLRGLRGICPVRDEIIRPLLCLEREEIEEWLRKQGIPWRVDSTNLSMDYTRNRIRGDILKCAKENINEKAIRHVAEAAAELYEIEEFLERRTEEGYRLAVREEEGERFIFAKAFSMQDSLIGDRILRRCMGELGGLKDVERIHIEMLRELFAKQTGTLVDLPGDRSARREYEGVRILCAERKEKQEKTEGNKLLEIHPVIPGSVIANGKKWKFSLLTEEKLAFIPEKTYTKWLDYDKIMNDLEIRGRRAGDYLEINREHGRKKLKAYLIDEKIPAKERKKLFLLADGSHIVWIPGYRISEAYKVTEDTRRILKIEISEGEKDG